MVVFCMNGLVEERVDLTPPPRPATLTALAPRERSLSQINCLSHWELVRGVWGLQVYSGCLEEEKVLCY